MSDSHIGAGMIRVAVAIGLASCGGSGVVDSGLLIGADEVECDQSELSASLPSGSVLEATTNVNLRAGPSTSNRVILVVPRGGRVTTVAGAPSNGYYNVRYAGQVGWSHGAYYKLVSPQPGPAGPRDSAVNRARSGVGFSYWWGHARFRPEGPTGTTAGWCTGDCPSCSHGGSYGGDCSGFAAKVLAVPSGNSDLATDTHPYTTWNFANEETYWHAVPRGEVEKADALVYNSEGAGHMLVFESGDGWGSMWAYECRGCAYGCVHDLRTVTSAYHAIARNGW